MEGLVTAYSGGSLTINVTRIGGSGTFADWNINVAGDPGAGDLMSGNNLSDVSNKDTALANLRGVSFGIAQNLIAAQQQQARTNIGAIGVVRTRDSLRTTRMFRLRGCSFAPSNASAAAVGGVLLVAPTSFSLALGPVRVVILAS
jgi:hypothetical protein